MVSFLFALAALVAGYIFYGAFIERLFNYDHSKPTPCVEHPDGVDFLPLPTWKVYMIQFLNIAGLGPIFGAIMGAKFGTASYLWIVFGTIFAGAVHDFTAALLSLRHDGASLPELIGSYLGGTTKKAFIVFVVVLMILVGAVFVSGPAELLAGMTPDWADAIFWIVVIFVYFILATLMPIDKIIGRFYPFFAGALIFMALGVLAALLFRADTLPELWNGLGPKYETNPVFPMMFVSIACGAISGFHATQSPMMCRCLKNSRHARPVFYGAMVTEGVVALIWAAAATSFFGENGVVDALSGKPFTGAGVANAICRDWLGTFGAILAIVGIAVAPITSGDTALRSARLIVADALHIDQVPIRKRLAISLPIFALTFLVLLYSISDANGFNVIWRYFAWCNQTLSVFTLWSVTVYLVIAKRHYIVTLLPALFMTAVCTSYLFVAPECLNLQGLGEWLAPTVGLAAALVAAALFLVWLRKRGQVE